MKEKEFPIIDKIIPDYLTRLGFLIYTIVAAILLILLGVLVSKTYAIIIFFSLYLFYVAARVKDWGGKPAIWVIILIAVGFLAVLSMPPPDEPKTLDQVTTEAAIAFDRQAKGLPHLEEGGGGDTLIFWIVIFTCLHSVFLFKAGNNSMLWFEGLKTRIDKAREIRELKREKAILTNEAKIKKLKKEIDDLNSKG